MRTCLFVALFFLINTSFGQEKTFEYPIKLELSVDISTEIPPFFGKLSDGKYVLYYKDFNPRLPDKTTPIPKRLKDLKLVQNIPAVYFSIKEGQLNGNAIWLGLMGDTLQVTKYTSGVRDGISRYYYPINVLSIWNSFGIVTGLDKRKELTDSYSNDLVVKFDKGQAVHYKFSTQEFCSVKNVVHSLQIKNNKRTITQKSQDYVFEVSSDGFLLQNVLTPKFADYKFADDKPVDSYYYQDNDYKIRIASVEEKGFTKRKMTVEDSRGYWMVMTHDQKADTWSYNGLNDYWGEVSRHYGVSKIITNDVLYTNVNPSFFPLKELRYLSSINLHNQDSSFIIRANPMTFFFKNKKKVVSKELVRGVYYETMLNGSKKLKWFELKDDSTFVQYDNTKYKKVSVVSFLTGGLKHTKYYSKSSNKLLKVDITRVNKTTDNGDTLSSIFKNGVWTTRLFYGKQVQEIKEYLKLGFTTTTVYENFTPEKQTARVIRFTLNHKSGLSIYINQNSKREVRLSLNDSIKEFDIIKHRKDYQINGVIIPPKAIEVFLKTFLEWNRNSKTNQRSYYSIDTLKCRDGYVSGSLLIGGSLAEFHTNFIKGKLTGQFLVYKLSYKKRKHLKQLLNYKDGYLNGNSFLFGGENDTLAKLSYKNGAFYGTSWKRSAWEKEYLTVNEDGSGEYTIGNISKYFSHGLLDSIVERQKDGSLNWRSTYINGYLSASYSSLRGEIKTASYQIFHKPKGIFFIETKQTYDKNLILRWQHIRMSKISDSLKYFHSEPYHLNYNSYTGFDAYSDLLFPTFSEVYSADLPYSFEDKSINYFNQDGSLNFSVLYNSSKSSAKDQVTFYDKEGLVIGQGNLLWSDFKYQCQTSSVFLDMECDFDYYRKDGSTIEDGTGMFYEYHPNGVLKTEGRYDEGKKSGEWKNYSLSGDLILVGTYVNGLKSGVWFQGDLEGIGDYSSECFSSNLSHDEIERLKSTIMNTISFHIEVYKNGLLVSKWSNSIDYNKKQ